MTLFGIKVKLETIVEGDLMGPVSLATTPRCRGGCYSFPQDYSLYPWSLPYNAERLEMRHQVPVFESLVWLDLGLNPGLLGHWRILYSLGQWFGIKWPEKDWYAVKQNKRLINQPTLFSISWLYYYDFLKSFNWKLVLKTIILMKGIISQDVYICNKILLNIAAVESSRNCDKKLTLK